VIYVHAAVFRGQLHVRAVVDAVKVLAHCIEAMQTVEDIGASENGGVLLAAVGSETDCASCLCVLVEYGRFRRRQREVAS